MALYMQYGCGWSAPEGWLNFDASPTLRFERIPVLGSLYTRNAKRFPAGVSFGDITRGLPLAPESCEGIYCSHVLEHLSFEDCLLALRNTHAYLKPGGIFRLVLPDLEQLARDYLSNPADDAAHRFMKESCLGSSDRARGLPGLARAALGNSAHLWMWDERSMRAALTEAGFIDVRRCEFNDSSDVRFREVEDPGRFAGCLAMECARPRA